MNYHQRVIGLFAVIISFYAQLHNATADDTPPQITDPTEDIEGNFSDIVRTVEGGVIYNTQENGINISGSFTHNEARARGGAIYNSGSLNTISARFSNNAAYAPRGVQQGPYDCGGGGAIYNTGTIGNIINSVFEGNEGTGVMVTSGGAIYNTMTIGSDAESGIIDAIFKGNSATLYGGAIYNHLTGNIYTVSATFEGNSALSGGGAIMNRGTMGNIIATFTGNYAYTESSVASGGAVHNEGTMGDISGDFTGNYVEGSSSSAFAGALYNGSEGVIGNITGHFTDNHIWTGGASSQVLGGAIRNMGQIGDITGDFINNYARSEGQDAMGGALYNYKGTLGRINGSFINNYAESKSYLAQGGAIYNSGTINGIVGDFSNNHIVAANEARGGAIYSSNQILSAEDGLGIRGNFSDNYAHSEASNALGGAIHVGDKKVGEIYGDFTNNYAIASSDKNARGGAIYNYGTMSHITGNFSGNYVSGINAATQGGAIFNIEIIGNLTGNFTGNYAVSKNNIARGGAIYNYSWGSLGDIIGDFVGNYASSETETALGGAIYNDGKWGRIINSSFIGNYAQGGDNPLGGAIYTTKDLEIVADTLQGGAGGGYSLFSGNWAGSEDNPQAIYMAQAGLTLTMTVQNAGKITFDDQIDAADGYNLVITGDNVGSIVTLNNTVGQAEVSVDNVTLRIGLTSDAVSDVFQAATVKINSGLVDTADRIIGSYHFKELTSNENARYQIDATLVNGVADNDRFDLTGITATGKITLSGFVMNEFEEIGDAAQEGNIYYFHIIRNASDDSIQLQFESELRKADQETAIMSSDDILADYFELTKTQTTNDTVKVGGWRDNLAAWAELEVDDSEVKIFTINEGDTQVLTRDIDALRGKDLTIKGVTTNILDLRGHQFLDTISSEQKVLLSNIILLNAAEGGMVNNGELHLDSVAVDDTLTLTNNNTLNISGKTDLNNTITSAGTEGHTLVIDDSLKKYDTATVVNIQGNIINQNITHKGSGTLADGDFTTVTNLIATSEEGSKSYSNFVNNSLIMEGGLFNVGNMEVARLKLRDFAVMGGTVYVEKSTINLTTETMGGIDAQRASYTANTTPDDQPGTDEPLGMDLDNDQQEENGNTDAPTVSLPRDNGVIWLNDFIITGVANRNLIHVKFVDESVAYAVKDGKGIANGAEPSGTAIIADENLLHNWEVTYNDPRAPQLGMYTLHVKDFTHEAQTAPVTDVTGSYVSMMQVYNYAFEHADIYSAVINKGRDEAASEKQPSHGYNRPVGASGGLWLHTYATHEDMPLRNGPKVGVNMYGGFVGGDTTLRQHSSGWASVYSLYGGYMGSTQKYGTVRIKQNGAAVGATATLYKQNFHMAMTASIGTSAADATGRGGRETFDMLMGGIAARAGYNIKLNSDYVLQPLLMVSYSCFNVHDYTNATGVKIDAKPTSVLQFHPTIKLIKHTDCAWNPYISAGFVYDCFSKTKFKANGYEMPHMSVKPYIEYSIGVQHTFRDSYIDFVQHGYRKAYTIFGQVTGHSGGRQGVEASIGLRYAM